VAVFDEELTSIEQLDSLVIGFDEVERIKF
jgi:hypothetical protein